MDVLWIMLVIVALCTVSWLGLRLLPSRRHPPQTTEQRLIEAEIMNRTTRHF